MSGWPDIAGLLAVGGQGPALQALLIVLGTFVLEDAATIAAAMLVQSGAVALPVGLGALYAGIVLGDLGLYGLGRLSGRLPWLARWMPAERRAPSRAWLDERLVQVVFVSRFIPGARLPTYTACGFLRASLPRFALAAVVATLIWTSLLFSVSLHLGAVLMTYLGAWRWAGAVGFAAALLLIGRMAARLQTVRR